MLSRVKMGYVLGLLAFVAVTSVGSVALADNTVRPKKDKTWQYVDEKSEVGQTRHIESDQDILNEIQRLEDMNTSSVDISAQIMQMYGKSVDPV